MNSSVLSKTWSCAAVAFALLVSGCGNPFGAGEASYKIFANLGKALSKPSQINDEQGSKASSKATVAQAQGMAKRLGKAAAGANDAYVVASGLDTLGNGLYRYWEDVVNQPSEEDADKRMTGRGMITFGYTGVPVLSELDTAKITSINSFEFIGRENKTWRAVIDSVRLKITFLDNSWTDRTFKPGLITAWGKNISPLIINGRGDTAAFFLDSLNEATSIQYGEGHFLDAHTGRASTEGPRSFDFAITVNHKGTYQNYQDNEGTITFALERAADADSLFFSIRFFEIHKREGTIWKKSNNGSRVKVATFTYDEKLMSGCAIYYNDDGTEISREDL